VRIWTIHPKHLDRQGLVALWREGLLAQKVLLGQTRGYRHHPQLIRFREHPAPVAAIASYLLEVWKEAKSRSYRFDKRKIGAGRTRVLIPESSGQLLFEWRHLKRKIKSRTGKSGPAPDLKVSPVPHPLFRIIPGTIRAWEKTPR
jgi:hypothetical protein